MDRMDGVPTVRDPREVTLARKRGIAVALLLVAASVLIAMQWLRHVHPSWGADLVATMAEAALVGGLADWFAVVALFRHPMGVPIPHTAIIPAKKDAIGASLANFICDHFLGKQQVIAKLEELDVAKRLAAKLADKDTAAKIGTVVVTAIPHLLKALDSKELHAFFHKLTRERLAQVNLSQVAALGLRTLTSNDRHGKLVDSALGYVRDALQSPHTQEQIAERVRDEVWSVLQYLGLKNMVADKVTAKLVAGTTSLVTDMTGNPEHPLRQKIAGEIEGLIQRLEVDPDLHRSVDALRDQLLEQSELSDYLRSLADDLAAWVAADIARPDSQIAANVAGASRKVGAMLLEDTATRTWINTAVRETVEPLVDRYRENVREFIVERIRKWSAEELTRELELSVGADLQYIRYNGTAVGAVIGGVIFVVLRGVDLLVG